MFDEFATAGALLRRQPALLVAGAAVAAVEALGYLLVGAAGVVDALGTVPGLGVGPLPPLSGVVLKQLSWVVLAPVPLAGLYTLARAELAGEGPAGGSDRSAAARFLAAGRRHYRRLAAATLAYKLAGLAAFLALVVGLHAVGFALATGLQAAAYAATGASSPPHPMLAVFLSGLLVGIARLGATVPFRFYDALVLFADDRPARSPLTSARFAVARPLALLEYAFVAGVAIAIPVLAAVATGRLLPELVAQPATGFATGPANPRQVLVAGVAGPAVAYLLVGAGAHALVGAYHVAFYERRVAPAVTRERDTAGAPAGADDVAGGDTSTAGDRPTRRPVTGEERPLVARRARVAVVALVVLGLLAGTAAVRVADVGSPTPLAAGAPVGDAPATAIVERAHGYTGNVSHRAVTRTWRTNRTTGERPLAFVQRRWVDFADRQGYVRLGAPGEDGLVGEGYFGEGTLAIRGAVPGPDRFGAFGRRVGEWTVVAAPGYASVESSFRSGSGRFAVAGRWRVVDRNASAIVLAPADEAARDAVLDRPSGADGRVVAGPDHRARLYVDSETGYPTRLVARSNATRYGEDGAVEARIDNRRVTTFDRWGTTDFGRLASLGGRSLLELLWDAASY